ncbi:MAG: hypothetical protein IT162_13865 [Bryobacterales bacterium]|nr:hypothetical protein [Bryobacterales bacterium]
MRCVRILLFCLAAAGCLKPAAAATGVTAIRDLPRVTAAMARAGAIVEIQATVTYCDPAWGLLFVQDATGAQFIYTKNDPVFFRPGTVLALTARAVETDRDGLLWTGVSYRDVRGAAAWQARPVSLADAEALQHDSQLVEVEGVLRPSPADYDGRIAFKIHSGGVSSVLVMPKRDRQYVARMMNAQVRVRGVEGTRFEKGRPAGALLFVGGPEELEVLNHPEPPPPGPWAALHAVDLRQQAVHAMRIAGQVVERRGKLLLLRDGSSGEVLPVMGAAGGGGGAKPGRTIEVTGFPGLTPFGRGLADASWRVVGSVDAPPPYQWETLTVLLLSASETPEGLRLRVRDAQGVERNALLPAAIPPTATPPDGATLRLTGMRGDTEFAAVSLEILPAPGIPWRLVGTVLAAILLAGAGAAIWVTTLRRTVRRSIADLEQSRATLETRVAERTKELQAEIAARRLAEAGLTRARDLAEAASHAKSSFLANMSHEFRTPLNAIIGYSEILAEDAHAAGVDATDPERIRTAAQHLLELVNDVLDLAKIEAGRLKLELEPASARRLTEDTLAAIESLATFGSNRLRLDLGDADADSLVQVDRLRFRQSLLNLVSNACKFTREGEVSVSVRRERVDGALWVRWDVRDTGIGIAPEDLAKLFKTFSQLETPGQARTGSGLGLAITRNLCEMMGGRVGVESELGRGSQFTIHLPCAGQIGGRDRA